MKPLLMELWNYRWINIEYELMSWKENWQAKKNVQIRCSWEAERLRKELEELKKNK